MMYRIPFRPGLSEFEGLSLFLSLGVLQWYALLGALQREYAAE